MRLLIATIACLGLAFAGLLAIGPARIWTLFGPADLGPVSFERLQRRSTPNDALVCPAELCRARSDAVPPIFAVSAAALRQAFTRIILHASRVSVVARNDQDLTDRYIQRSALMRFPDTIVVRYLERPDGQSTLAIYSRSQLGRSDLGVNRARIEHWLALLRAAVPVVSDAK